MIIGRKTYDKVQAMGFEYPHSDKKNYVIARTPAAAAGNIEFYSGSLAALVSQLKAEPGKDIFCDGGAEIVNLLMKDSLIDEFIVSVIPVFLGSGIRLFHSGRPETRLTLLGSKAFDTGLMQLHYLSNPARPVM